MIPLCASKATDDKDIEQFKKILYTQYCEKLKWFPPENFDDNLFVDEFDECSVFYVIKKESSVIGGLRIVHNSSIGLPHQEDFDNAVSISHVNNRDTHTHLSNLLPSDVVEITRAVGERQVKSSIIYALGECLRCAALHAEAKIFFAIVDLDTFTMARRVGIPLEPIGVPLHRDGSWTVPIFSTRENLINQKIDAKSNKFLS